jgi:hypothetical protein
MVLRGSFTNSVVVRNVTQTEKLVEILRSAEISTIDSALTTLYAEEVTMTVISFIITGGIILILATIFINDVAGNLYFVFVFQNLYRG